MQNTLLFTYALRQKHSGTFANRKYLQTYCHKQLNHNSFLYHGQTQIIQNLQIRRFIRPIKILARPFYQYLYDCFNIIFQTLFQNGDAKGCWCIGGGINVPVNVTLKANNSQAKEIIRLVIQKKMKAVLTLMDVTTQNSRKINTVA